MMRASKKILKQQGVYEQTRKIFDDNKDKYGIGSWWQGGMQGASIEIKQHNTIYTNEASRDIQQTLITSARQVETAMGLV